MVETVRVKDDGMNLAIVELLTKQDKTFYASLILQMKRIKEEKMVSGGKPTMGVSVVNGAITLYYHPDITKIYSIQQLCAIMEHECDHVVFNHIIRGKTKTAIAVTESGEQVSLWNYAADIAINQLISGLPEECLSYDKFKFPAGLSAEGYYELLLEKGKQDSKKMMTGKGNMAGNHDKWKEASSDPATEALSKEIIRQAVKSAVKDAQKQHGRIPSGLEIAIAEWMKEPTLNWKQMLKLYVGNSVKANFKLSWKRPSRRFDWECKGVIPNRQLKITLACDTSGSVGQDEFKEFIGEMNGLMKCYKSEVTVLECDAQVHKAMKIQPNKKIQAKFHGGGGTSYEPVFKYITDKKLQTELLIYFTDFYCDFPKVNPKFKVLWVVTSTGDMRNIPPYGKVIQIKPIKK